MYLCLYTLVDRSLRSILSLSKYCQCSRDLHLGLLIVVCASRRESTNNGGRRSGTRYQQRYSMETPSRNRIRDDDSPSGSPRRSRSVPGSSRSVKRRRIDTSEDNTVVTSSPRSASRLMQPTPSQQLLGEIDETTPSDLVSTNRILRIMLTASYVNFHVAWIQRELFSQHQSGLHLLVTLQPQNVHLQKVEVLKLLDRHLNRHLGWWLPFTSLQFDALAKTQPSSRGKYVIKKMTPWTSCGH